MTSISSPPCAISFKFRIALRKLLPSCDNRPQPNINRTMPKTTTSSAKPKPNIVSPTGTQNKRPNVDVSKSSAGIWGILCNNHHNRDGFVAPADVVNTTSKHLVGAGPRATALSLSKPTPGCQPEGSLINQRLSRRGDRCFGLQSSAPPVDIGYATNHPQGYCTTLQV